MKINTMNISEYFKESYMTDTDFNLINTQLLVESYFKHFIFEKKVTGRITHLLYQDTFLVDLFTKFNIFTSINKNYYNKVSSVLNCNDKYLFLIIFINNFVLVSYDESCP